MEENVLKFNFRVKSNENELNIIKKLLTMHNFQQQLRAPMSFEWQTVKHSSFDITLI